MSFDIANFNLLNWANATPDLYDSTPKDVTITLKDENGNLFNKTVANRGKFKQQLWDDVGGALGQFRKKFYVNAVNGDDNNDGTSTNPFKTIKKACDSTPIGGAVEIVLKTDVNLDNTIVLVNKNVYLVGSYKITIQNDSSNWSGKFIMTNSVIKSYGVDWDFGIDNSDLSGVCIYDFRFGADDEPSAHSINTFSVRNGTINFYNLAIVASNIYFDTVTINRLDDNKNFISIVDNICNIGVSNTTVKDSSGNNISIPDICSGVVKDANGVPRNIISNIVF
jgi:hypothetical protein